mmetsp:Transcript_17289/g.33917  ORF Transcript_17289/g.33917 Transcript_17289/m.33917 type:complete len:83 (-) Transcript_17289:316-564(-)
MDEMMRALGEMCGDVPAPTHTKVTTWGADARSLGAYSYTKVGGNGGSDFDVPRVSTDVGAVRDILVVGTYCCNTVGGLLRYM